MIYTHNWNQEFIENTNIIPKKSLDNVLEIGSFEGLTSNYIVDNLLTEAGKLFCIDPLTDVYLNNNLTEKDKENNQTIYKYFNNQYDRFISNTAKNTSKINLIRKLSIEAFPELLLNKKNYFDLIYIDGDHRADAVYIDAINCFKLCKVDGYIIFDDYAWGNEIYKEQATRFGVDKFLNEYKDNISIILKNYQIMIKRIN